MRADVAAHGSRFLILEFAAAACLFIVLAAGLSIIHLLRSDFGLLTLASVVFFLGAGINSVAVVKWARRPRVNADKRVSLSDLARFAVLTLVPAALALALAKSNRGERTREPWGYA